MTYDSNCGNLKIRETKKLSLWRMIFLKSPSLQSQPFPRVRICLLLLTVASVLVMDGLRSFFCPLCCCRWCWSLHASRVLIGTKSERARPVMKRVFMSEMKGTVLSGCQLIAGSEHVLFSDLSSIHVILEAFLFTSFLLPICQITLTSSLFIDLYTPSSPSIITGYF